MTSRAPGVWPVLAALATLALAVGALVISLLYSTARQGTFAELERAAETLAALMESVARHEAKLDNTAPHLADGGPVTKLVERGLAGYIGHRAGEELVIGRKTGDRIQVLLAHPDSGFEVATEFEYTGHRGHPLYEAIEGRRGKGRFVDYRGVPVLAAYAPVPTLRIGIVYKIDVAAFNAPYIRTGIRAGAIYLALIATVVTAHLLGTRRITRRLAANEAREAARLLRLRRLSELSITLTGDLQNIFEQIVRIIGELFAVRVVCLSEIDGPRLVFRAVYVDGRVIAQAGGCPLDTTPCATVEENKDIQVYDRVAELFPEAGFLREHRAHAYCGFPSLDSQGRVAAVTCLLDDKPREFTEDDRQILRIIGQRLATELERARTLAERERIAAMLRESEVRLKEAQRIARLGNWELDLTGNHLHWSDEIFRLFELDPARFGASYEAFLAAIHPDDRDAVNTAYTRSLRDRAPYTITHRLLMADGRIKWVEERCTTEFAPDGTPLLSRGTVQDITEREEADRLLRASLAEKELLLREIHHRVKNNLQIVTSLLHLQARRTDDPAALAIFADARNRLRSMILVHEQLYSSQNLSRVDFAGYIHSLVGQLANNTPAPARPVPFTIEAAPLPLPIHLALPCGLILTELVLNVLKYAFPTGKTGHALVRLEREGDHACLTVRDDGAGLPPGFDPAQTATFGWQLIRNLVEQLDGSCTIGPNPGPGTCVRVRFPIPPDPVP